MRERESEREREGGGKGGEISKASVMFFPKYKFTKMPLKTQDEEIRNFTAIKFILFL